jgi:hypothetical protein
MNEPEVWRPVKGWEHCFEVSSHGRVRSLQEDSYRKPRILNASPLVVPRVVLAANGRLSRPTVRRLIAEAFLGWRPGQRIISRDGDRTKVRADNLLLRGKPAAERRADLGQRRALLEQRSALSHEARHSGEVEEWRPVVGWESLYEVSSLGCVRRADGLVLVPHLNRGHPTVVLNREGKGSVRAVSHLVYEAFVSAPGLPYYHVAHKDGDRTNNRVGNLELVHPARDELRPRKARKLTPEQVLQIRAEADTCSRAEMARRFGVSKRLVVQIILRTRWKRAATDRGRSGSDADEARID